MQISELVAGIAPSPTIAGATKAKAMQAAGQGACNAIWQNKHLGKANLLFCDGHGESKLIGRGDGEDPVGETIKTPGLNYSPNPTINSCASVRGMWTHAAGD